MPCCVVLLGSVDALVAVGEGLVVVAAVLLGLLPPITPVQILWVNMITAITLAIALAAMLAVWAIATPEGARGV